MRKLLFKKRQKCTLVFFIFSIFVFLVILFLFQKEIKEVVLKISAPIENFFLIFREKTNEFLCKKEKKELENLRKNLFLKLTEKKELSICKREKDALAKALLLKEKRKVNFVLAKIISGESLDRNYLIINKGKESNLKKGEVVISPEKVLIGKISELFSNYSKVKLISAPKSKFPIKIKEKEGIAEGKGNFKIFFKYFPKELEIKEGEFVFTDQGKDFPEGLLVGQVISFQKSDIKEFQKGEIKPAFLILPPKEVLIIKK